MNIVIYSTSANSFNPKTYKISQFPSCSSLWEQTYNTFPDCKISVVTQLPGAFITDYNEEGEAGFAKNVDFYIRPLTESTEETTLFISNLHPDLAIAASFWTSPFDWLNIKDSIIASLLEQKGIKTICHNTQTCLTCFDKWTTHLTLKSMGFNVADAIYVDHNLFFNANSKKDILQNPYKEAVIQQLKKLSYPVIIKDTTGLSSVGMDVVNTFEEALALLSGKRNNGNRIVEQYISGIQAGCEVYGKNGIYTVTPPFFFSVNKYGITSPKQSVKLGPIESPDYKITELKQMIIELAKKLNLSGIAQIDLVYKDGRWFIIEVNPRLSGMSLTYAASMDTTIYTTLLTASLFPEKLSNTQYKSVLNIKLPLLTQSQIDDLIKIKGICYIRQINNIAAKQDREKGFCELIIRSDNGFDDLKQRLDYIKTNYPDIIEPSFYDNAVKLLLTVHKPYMQ